MRVVYFNSGLFFTFLVTKEAHALSHRLLNGEGGGGVIFVYLGCMREHKELFKTGVELATLRTIRP